MKKSWFRMHGAPLATLAGLGISFFGSLVLATCFYSGPYQWDETVMSTLSSPRDNPHAYGIACAGLAISGLLLLPCETFVRTRLEPFSPVMTILAGRLFRTGAVFMTFSELVVNVRAPILGVSHLHLHLSQIFGVALCLSLIVYLAAFLRLPGEFFRLRITAIFFVALPVVTFVLDRVYFFLAYENLTVDAYQLVKHSLWNSLALWEWMGATCIYGFLGLVILGLPDAGKEAVATCGRSLLSR